MSPTAEWIEETGTAVISDGVSPAALARDLAIRNAEAEARSKIRARLDKIEVQPGRTVTEEMARDPYARSRISGLLQGARSAKPVVLGDGRVEASIKLDLDFVRRICLYGPQSDPLGSRGAAPAPAHPASVSSMVPPMILLLGDSLASSPGASGGPDLATQLGRLLGQPVVYVGVENESSLSGVGRISKLLDVKPQMVIVFLGFVDQRRFMPVETLEMNLDGIVGQCQKAGATTVLVGISEAPGDALGQMFERLAAKRHCLLVPDVLNGLSLLPGPFPDTARLSDADCTQVANRIAARLRAPSTPLAPTPRPLLP